MTGEFEISEKDIALFTRQLATMMKSGVPLLQAFDIGIKGSGNPALARSIEHRFPYLDPLNHLQVELLRRHVGPHRRLAGRCATHACIQAATDAGCSLAGRCGAFQGGGV